MDYAIPIAIVTVAGSAVYLWLTLVGAPALAAINATTSHAWTGAWLAVITSALLITIVPAAAIVLATLVAPAAAQFVLAGPELLRGLQIGTVVWATRAAVFRHAEDRRGYRDRDRLRRCRTQRPRSCRSCCPRAAVSATPAERRAYRWPRRRSTPDTVNNAGKPWRRLRLRTASECPLPDQMRTPRPGGSEAIDNGTRSVRVSTA